MRKRLFNWLCVAGAALLLGGVLCYGLEVSGHFPSLSPTSAAAAPLTEPRPSPASAPSSAPTPTAEPAKEIADWQLILVGGEQALAEDFAVELRPFEGERVDARVHGELTDMLRAAKEAGLKLWVASGYRDERTQEKLLARAVANRMADYGMSEKEAKAHALKTIARPGYSEHHTGLAVDFNDVSRDFSQTEEYRWLSENAAAYGFVQRYGEGKETITGIEYEPWHYRYVGAEHARAMNRLGLCLEEYIAHLKAQQCA